MPSTPALEELQQEPMRGVLMPTNDLIQAIRRQGRTLAYLARELEMDPSLLRKKLLGQRRPFTEAQARHLRAILGVRLEDIPYIPDDTKAVA
jgi:hypothetical protein